MTEKKTFKNPKFVSGMSLKTPQYWEVHNEIFGEPVGTFTRDEWDMEVTFTRKPKPFQVNDQVVVKGGGELAVIWHIIDDRAWVNVVATSSGAYRDSHHVVKLSELKHAS